MLVAFLRRGGLTTIPIAHTSPLTESIRQHLTGNAEGHSEGGSPRRHASAQRSVFTPPHCLYMSIFTSET